MGRQRKKKEKEKRGGGTKVLPAIRTNSLSNFSSKRVCPWNTPLLGYFSKFTLGYLFPKSILPNWEVQIASGLGIWLVCLSQLYLFATSTLPNHKVHGAIWLFCQVDCPIFFPVCPKNQTAPDMDFHRLVRVPPPPPFSLSLF
jgi:hypothetical protein